MGVVGTDCVIPSKKCKGQGAPTRPISNPAGQSARLPLIVYPPPSQNLIRNTTPTAAGGWQEEREGERPEM